MVFSCHINVSSGWEYMWTKDMRSLSHTENRLTISPQQSSDQGSYECQAKRGTNHLFLTAKSQAVNVMVEGMFVRFCIQQVIHAFTFPLIPLDTRSNSSSVHLCRSTHGEKTVCFRCVFREQAEAVDGPRTRR